MNDKFAFSHDAVYFIICFDPITALKIMVINPLRVFNSGGCLELSLLISEVYFLHGHNQELDAESSRKTDIHSTG
jgi:hypothetical protein